MVVVETPSERKPPMGKSIRNFSTVTRVGLDLAKRVFQIHAVDAKGEIVVARKFTRSQLIPFFATVSPCVVAMEACSSAHHWGRALIELGHEVRLLPPAHVKPYVRRNKNDPVDAAAICEAMSRPGQRFVPVEFDPSNYLISLGRTTTGGLCLRRAVAWPDRCLRDIVNLMSGQRRKDWHSVRKGACVWIVLRREGAARQTLSPGDRADPGLASVRGLDWLGPN
jgi:hypothetical protein